MLKLAFHHQTRSLRALYSTQSGLLPLPEAKAWKKTFPHNSAATRDRPILRNSDTAALLANTFVPEGSKDKVIIESEPGA